MTVRIELPPQVEQAYLAYAHAKGVSVDDIVREVVIAGLPLAPPAARLSPDEWASRFEEWADSLGSSPGVPEPADRGQLYPDRW